MAQPPAASLGPSLVVPLPSFSGLGPAAQTQGCGALLGWFTARTDSANRAAAGSAVGKPPPDMKTSLVVLEPKGPSDISQPNSLILQRGNRDPEMGRESFKATW